MKHLTLILLGISTLAFAQQSPNWNRADQDPKATEQWEPEPEVVTPGEANSDAPSDAIVLFDGTNLDSWKSKSGEAVEWTMEDGAMEVKAGAGAITSKEKFGDMQLHLEWASPEVVEGKGQQRGNSGVFLMGRYEIQILDSYENRTYSNGQAGSIYKQQPPAVNACRPSGEWQTYDIFFEAPIFGEDGQLRRPAYATVIHNGILIHHHVALKGPTQYKGLPVYKAHGDAPIMLQDHGNPVRYRNIWARKL
ncbi:DUF1080 domain-containing protein [Pontibacter sp. G13]|uniref:3-keto-disaccharide hydrolase n=1 Tax=Pontibacter sp. G13 TaxID=3074898 RepID=UPI00288A0C5E|nr:DUF1080 domain-containing protein [Pontibacter sp. G13]WNJ17510.1 DUF1080 domain-containing protein [Pontibacter sp. G13]